MENIQSKIVVAKKDHICDWCGCRIPKGHHYMSQTCVDNGEIWNWHGHLFCEEAIDKIPGMYDGYKDGDGITAAHFEACIIEWLDENHSHLVNGRNVIDPEWNPSNHPFSEIIKKAVREIRDAGHPGLSFEPSFPEEYR